VNWIQLTQDRVQWRTVVNTTVNLTGTVLLFSIFNKDSNVTYFKYTSLNES
jgi:hypothetical protein